ncbi:MAG: FixH family protein [Chloroflexi bacterium]|nr:FixH family protein [Chloroflexota bacterium]
MKAVVLLLSVLLAACGTRVAVQPTPVNVSIAVRAESEPLAVGATTLLVSLTDSSGRPIDGATLRVHGDMDHAGMVSVDREVKDSANGEYRVPFEWTMGGGWIVTVTAQLPDNGGEISKTVEFFVEAVASDSIINRHAAATAEATADAAVSIAYEPDHNPARLGSSEVTVTVTTAEGRPVTDAAVAIIGNMAHAGMMPVSGHGEHVGGGRYTVPLAWTMAGDWQVTITVTLADGQQVEQTFDQEVVIR